MIASRTVAANDRVFQHGEAVVFQEHVQGSSSRSRGTSVPTTVGPSQMESIVMRSELSARRAQRSLRDQIVEANAREAQKPDHARRSVGFADVVEAAPVRAEEVGAGSGVHPGRELRTLTAAECARFTAAIDGDLGVDLLAPVVTDTQVLRWYTARQAHGAAVQLLGAAVKGSFVMILGFTFDRQDICDAAVAAHQRGGWVTVVLDKRMTLAGKTKEQLSRTHVLAAAGIIVRLYEGGSSHADYAAVGRSGGWLGIQHAKGVLVDARAIIGSANWTTATRSNSEVSMLVLATGAEGQRTMRDVFWRVALRSEMFADAAVAERIRSSAEDGWSRARRSRSLPRLVPS
jgi:hypothetical protein